MVISSQRFINEEIVAEKIAAEDFEVMLSPGFEIDGEIYQVVLDGHHSLQAAKQAGVDPFFWVADCSDHDAIGLLDAGNIDDFMMAVHMGNDYYNTETGKDVW
jgi:hypothetical protein